jgi:hypothetical protein
MAMLKRIVWPWEKKKVQRELDSVEKMLESFYTPVPARPDFLTGLRKRLVGKSGPLAKASLTTLEFIVLVGGAIIGTIVFVFTLVRSVLLLISGVRNVRKPGEKKAKPKDEIEGKKKRAR